MSYFITLGATLDFEGIIDVRCINYVTTFTRKWGWNNPIWFI